MFPGKCAKSQNFRSQNHFKTMKKITQVLIGKQVTLEGMMTFSQSETGLRTLDFMCCEDAQAVPFVGCFKVQGMRDGNVYMTEKKRPVRNNALLIRKAAHGRLSGTRDHAWQLTLKVFASEGIDWQRVFVTEPIETLTPLIGKGRMREILQGVLNRLDADDYAKV